MISGGQTQRLMLARALYKNGAFLILDELTAALDPIAEAEIYSKFDQIAVFHEGAVIQQGTHEEIKESTFSFF